MNKKAWKNRITEEVVLEAMEEIGGKPKMRALAETVGRMIGDEVSPQLMRCYVLKYGLIERVALTARRSPQQAILDKIRELEIKERYKQRVVELAEHIAELTRRQRELKLISTKN